MLDQVPPHERYLFCFTRPVALNYYEVLTAAFPTFLTTQASMADLPLITVTLLGVVGSINGGGVGSSVVVPDPCWKLA